MSDRLTLHFPQSNRQVDLSLEGKEKIIAGVSDGCDLNLRHYLYGPIERISRRHFELYKTNNHVAIKDLKSTNGTEVNDQPLWSRRAQILSNGDVIKLAQNDDFTIEIKNPSPEKPNGNLSQALPEKPDLGIRFDEDSGQFILDGNMIPHSHLTELEYRLLQYFYENANKICSIYRIGTNVWYGYASDNTIAQSIYRLRRKLNRISPGAGARYLITSRGYRRGYLLLTGWAPAQPD